jgi:hypothetical protein
MRKALVRVEYFYDPDSRNWGYEVPSLNIIGGADTREAAEEQAIAAIAYTLDCAHERSLPTEGEVGYLQVTVDRERTVAAQQASQTKAAAEPAGSAHTADMKSTVAWV